MKAKTEKDRRGEKCPRKNNPVSEVSPMVKVRGGPAAKIASPLVLQGAPGLPPSSSGILDTMLLKAMEVPDTLPDSNPLRRMLGNLHTSTVCWARSSHPGVLHT